MSELPKMIFPYFVQTQVNVLMLAIFILFVHTSHILVPSVTVVEVLSYGRTGEWRFHCTCTCTLHGYINHLFLTCTLMNA